VTNAKLRVRLLQEIMNLEHEVSRALDALASSVEIVGPITTDNHTNYVVTGLADTQEQQINLCWCILGFVGSIMRADFAIDSAIGEGATARDNLMTALGKRLDVNKDLTLRQKERKRDPLLQELICHALVRIHQRRRILPKWLGHIQACVPPHLSPNDSGLDLIGVGVEKGAPFPVIGEVKAYEMDPLGGFANACEKFSQVRRGEYNDEIRQAMITLDANGGFSRQQLADNIWVELGRFGAVVGHDRECHLGADTCCDSQKVVAQDPGRLFFVTSPYGSMRKLFDTLIDRLVVLANRLGAEAC